MRAIGGCHGETHQDHREEQGGAPPELREVVDAERAQVVNGTPHLR